MCFQNYKRENFKCQTSDEQTFHGFYCECCSIVNNSNNCVSQTLGYYSNRRDYNSFNLEPDETSGFSEFLTNCTSDTNYNLFCNTYKDTSPSTTCECIDDEGQKKSQQTFESDNIWNLFKNTHSPLLNQTELISVWFFLTFFLFSFLFLTFSLVYLCRKQKRIRMVVFDKRLPVLVSGYRTDDDLKFMIE